MEAKEPEKEEKQEKTEAEAGRVELKFDLILSGVEENYG